MFVTFGVVTLSIVLFVFLLSYVSEESDNGEEYEMEVESEDESESPYETETETAITGTEESVDLGRSVDVLHLKII